MIKTLLTNDAQPADVDNDLKTNEIRSIIIQIQGLVLQDKHLSEIILHLILEFLHIF